MKDGIATGFDVELMRAVCGRLRLELRPLSYEGENFNDIFAGLAQGTCDAVISGTTITPERAATLSPDTCWRRAISPRSAIIPMTVSAQLSMTLKLDASASLSSSSP